MSQAQAVPDLYDVGRYKDGEVLISGMQIDGEDVRICISSNNANYAVAVAERIKKALVHFDRLEMDLKINRRLIEEQQRKDRDVLKGELSDKEHAEVQDMANHAERIF